MTKTIVKEVGTEMRSGVPKKIIRHFRESKKAWYNEDDDNIFHAVSSTLAIIDNAQRPRRYQNMIFSALYGNKESSISTFRSNNSIADNKPKNRIALNIIQSVIDAVAAKVAKDLPKVSFVTSGADDYFLKLRVAKLTKYINGLFNQSELYENSELVFRDAEVYGTGFVLIYQDDGEIKTEWCAQDEIRVDEIDGLKQKPRSIHRVSIVPIEELMIRYPDKKNLIENSVFENQGLMQVESTVEMIQIRESWHLPTRKESGDGKHCITIQTGTLLSEEYKKSYFPIVPYRWYSNTLGFFGRSITEEIKEIQVDINKTLRTIQQSQELICCPIIFVPNEAEVAEDVLLSNVIARMVPYSGGQPPSIVSPQGLSPEVYSHLNSLIEWAFQIVGLSQTTASGMKPAGVDSAVAIREVSDIETGRFAQSAKRWEQFFVKCAEIMVDMSKDLYTQNPDLRVSIAEKKMLSEIKWKDVDLQDRAFEIQAFPTSQLPDTPAGRIQTISEYIQNQWITKEKGMELMNLDPDLEGEVNLQTASLRLVEKWLTQMAEDGIYHKPEPVMNLQLAQSVAQSVCQQMILDGLPEERVQLIRDFVNECIELQKPPPAPPMPAAPPGMMPPGAPPSPDQAMQPMPPNQ